MKYYDDQGNELNIRTELDDMLDRIYDELDKMTPEERMAWYSRGIYAKPLKYTQEINNTIYIVCTEFNEITKLGKEGKIGTLIVRDHSRLGRNRLVVGALMEEEFDRMGIRYIAVMDNIDTKNGISDLVPMQDLFNEWHAKNTSDKVRRVFQNKGKAGKPLTTNPPFGYMKNPDNKDEWHIDEPAAEIVKRIFKMCVSGLGPSQIAKQLKADKLMTPTEYWISIGRNCGKPPSVPYHWCTATVSDILGKQEYCGDTVNFRSQRKSFKNKKKVELPPEKWLIFENTHPAIIDRETFELINELINRIEVHAPRYMDGKRYQMIDIYYKGVGIIKTLSPEDFEKIFQKNMAKRKQQKKTA